MPVLGERGQNVPRRCGLVAVWPLTSESSRPMLRRLYTVEITSSKLERLSLLSVAEEFDMAMSSTRVHDAGAGQPGPGFWNKKLS